MNEENISNDDREASSNNTFDLALRPKKLKDFIGQKKVQGNLSTFIKAASERDEPMDHILLHGCLLYTSPSPRDVLRSRMPSSA